MLLPVRWKPTSFKARNCYLTSVSVGSVQNRLLQPYVCERGTLEATIFRAAEKAGLRG
jgi:hypothetical protein